jgi:hypothetical protein
MDSLRAEALRLGRELREQFRGRGEFTTDQFRAELGPLLRGLGDEDFIDFVAYTIDRDSTTEDPEPPDGFDVTDEYRLDRVRRVAKARATFKHMQQALDFSDRELAWLEASAARRRAAGRN